MRGMGTLLSMYGQAGGATEQEARELEIELAKINAQLSQEKVMFVANNFKL
jgi:hypothetical protein